MKTKISLFLFLSIVFSAFSQDIDSNKKWTLQECVDYAIENNISVKQNEYNVNLAEITKKDAIGNFLPTLNAQGNHAWNSGLNVDVTTGLLRNQTTQTTSAGIGSGITIFNGLRNLNELRRADLTILANQYQVDKIKDDISLNVINAYLLVLFNKEAVKVAEPQLEVTREQLNRTSKLVEAGTLPRGDLFDIQATIASDEQNLVVTQNNVKLSLISLAQLLQLRDYDNFDIADEEIATLPLVNLGSYTVDQIYQKALENRNEIKVAKTNIDIAEKDISLAKGNLYPTLTGFFNWNSRYSTFDRIVGSEIDPDNPTVIIGQVEGTGQNVISPNFKPVTGDAADFSDQFDDNAGTNYGIGLQIPILNGFRASNNVKRAKINYEQTKYQLTQEELNLERTINTVYADAQGSLKVYEAAQKSVLAQEESFRYAQEKYNVGIMNSFEYSQIKNRLVKAQSDYLRAKYEYIFRVKLLEFYYGVPVNLG
jgi:outer membrane protein